MRMPLLAALTLATALCASALAPTAASAQPAAASGDTASTVSAEHLLHLLKVKPESHALTYISEDFHVWDDADGDGENTRAEVLSAESTKPVTLTSEHTVKSGRWVSPYDGKAVAAASKLEIDHLVPFSEAWTSGAYKWSPNKREAFANDLDYPATLIAVTAHAHHAKGSKEPGDYLPPKTSFRCAYVRDWIGVKYRWGLSVDKQERAVLANDLDRFCRSLEMRKPATPDIDSLIDADLRDPSSDIVDTSADVRADVTSSVPVTTPTTSTTSTLYANCDAAWAAGAAPIYSWESGYSRSLDSDGDGIACEDTPTNLSIITGVPSGSGSSSLGSGYSVVCRDGSISQSGGKQGACSHHGGVS